MKERGISLIALIITIIVIIILAAISIAGVSGIVERSRYAKFCGDLDAVQDAVSQAYGTKRIKEAQDPNGLKTSEEIYKWVATGGDDDKLEKTTGLNKQDLYKLADESVLGLDLPKYGDHGWGVDPKTGEVFLIDGFEYDGNTYYSKADIQNGPSGNQGGDDDVEGKEAKAVVKPGDYIKYTPEAKVFTIEKEKIHEEKTDLIYNTGDYTGLWRVLYNDETHGLQIISATNVTADDKKLFFADEEGYDYSDDIVIKYGDDSIDLLNNFSRCFVDEKYAVSGRCVGTDPEDPDKKEIFEYDQSYKEIENDVGWYEFYPYDNIQDFCNQSEDYQALMSPDGQDLWLSNDDYFFASRWNGSGVPHPDMEWWGGDGLFYMSASR